MSETSKLAGAVQRMATALEQHKRWAGGQDGILVSAGDLENIIGALEKRGMYRALMHAGILITGGLGMVLLHAPAWSFALAAFVVAAGALSSRGSDV